MEILASETTETSAEEVAEKAAETEEAVAKVAAETVAEEMSENFSEEEAETEKITVKLAETEELVKRKGSPPLHTHAKHRKFANFTKSTKCRITKTLEMPKSFLYRYKQIIFIMKTKSIYVIYVID